MKEILNIYLYTLDPQIRLSSGPDALVSYRVMPMTRLIPKVQLCEVFRRCVPCSLFWLRRGLCPSLEEQGWSGLESQKFWFPVPNSLFFFFFLLIEGFCPPMGGKNPSSMPLWGY